MKSIKNILKKRIHISWHIAWLAAGILVGISFSPRTASLFGGYEWLVMAASMFLIVLPRRLVLMLILSFSSGLIIGLWRGTLEYGALASYHGLYGKEIVLRGSIIEDTSYGSTGDLRLRIGRISIEDRVLPGTVWASLDTNLELKRGDIVMLSGRLDKGFGNIPASMFRAKVIEAERPNPGDVGRRVRDWFSEGARKAIPEPQASLGLGFLAGQRSALPEALGDQMRLVGLTHIIVASGYNLTVLVGISRRLLANTSRYLATISAGGMILAFIFVTGQSPSMSRAGLVSGLSLLAWYYGRSMHPVVLLLVSAAITAISRPSYVWGDLGWYLSFMAFAGVILLAPLIHDYFWGAKKKPGVLREIIIGTLAAQLITLPIILYSFGHYSTYALPANILVLPLIPVSMLLTFLGSVAGLALPSIAPLVGMPATLVLKYMTAVIGWFANLSGSRELKLSFQGMLVSYVFICAIIVFLWIKTRHNFRDSII